MRRRIVMTFVALSLTMSADAYTVSIIGVVVSSDDQRIGGVTVGLYATSAGRGGRLAQDRTSDRGIFNLVLNNVTGDLGQLWVVYEDQGMQASPLRVILAAAQNGLSEARTRDLKILASPTAQDTPHDVSERIAAIAETQQVLVAAGIKSQEDASAVVGAQTAAMMRLLPAADQLRVVGLTELKLSTFTLSRVKDVAAKAFEQQRIKQE